MGNTGPRNLSDVKARLSETISGGTAFGFSFYGNFRASQYANRSPRLAQLVAQGWQVTKEETEEIGKAAADLCVRYFPADMLDTASDFMGPAILVFGLWIIFQQRAEHEKALLEQFTREMVERRNAQVLNMANGNGSAYGAYGAAANLEDIPLDHPEGM